MRFHNIVLLSLLAISSSSSAQDAKFVLRKAYEKCQGIQGGYFESKEYSHQTGKRDTTEISHQVYFKKIVGDTIADCVFHYSDCDNNSCPQEWVYTGNEYVSISHKDSTATIYNRNLWPAYVKRTTKFRCFSPITHSASYPLPDSANMYSPNVSITMLKEEDILKQPCYHIRLSVWESTSGTASILPLNQIYDYWISVVDFMPLQYTTNVDVVIKGDTTHRFQKYILTKYELDKAPDARMLTLGSIPTNYFVKDYAPADKGSIGLVMGSTAPDWQLKTLKGEIVRLRELRGKVVLLQFFYKDSPGYLKSLPVLAALNKKYRKEGLEIIAIDVMNKEPGLEEFLEKRKVDYTVLAGTKEVVKPYNLVYYPTIYILDRDNRIRTYKDGYSEKLQSELEEVIIKAL